MRSKNYNIGQTAEGRHKQGLLETLSLAVEGTVPKRGLGKVLMSTGGHATPRHSSGFCANHSGNIWILRLSQMISSMSRQMQVFGHRCLHCSHSLLKAKSLLNRVCICLFYEVLLKQYYTIRAFALFSPSRVLRCRFWNHTQFSCS